MRLIAYFSFRSQNLLSLFLSSLAGIMTHDIASALQSLGIVHKPDSTDKPVIVIDWSLVDTLVNKESSRTRIKIDPECLRWTPLISPIVVRQTKEVNFVNMMYLVSFRIVNSFLIAGLFSGKIRT